MPGGSRSPQIQTNEDRIAAAGNDPAGHERARAFPIQVGPPGVGKCSYAEGIDGQPGQHPMWSGFVDDKRAV